MRFGNPNCTLDSVIEKIDIGGPTMLSSGSKGQRLVICDPLDRTGVLNWIKAGQPDDGTIENLCAKADFTVSRYRMVSAAYRSQGRYAGIFGTLSYMCKYGENAWQKFAGLFSSGRNDSLSIDRFELVAGGVASYNNICDLDRLLQTITHIAAGFESNLRWVPKIAVGVKHGNPCGAAFSDSTEDALELAMCGDHTAIFGGGLITNFPIGEREAEKISVQKLDIIAAPSISGEAVVRLERKHGKCRFMVNPALGSIGLWSLDTNRRFRYVRGGFLMQDNYTHVLDLKNPSLKKYGIASMHQEFSLILAWAVGSTSNSNTATIVRDNYLIGNGVGQQDRVGAAELAVRRTVRPGHILEGTVAYSDSFFPYPDGPEALVKAGIRTILASSGSIRDKETIELCSAHNVVLYMIPDAEGRGFFGH